MKTVWFVVPLLVTTFGFAACANAEIYYPWCAYYGGGGQGGGTNCGWSTYEQCMVTIRGMGEARRREDAQCMEADLVPVNSQGVIVV